MSADYVRLWHTLLGVELGDSGVGFCGSVASALYILEMTIKASREVQAKAK